MSFQANNNVFELEIKSMPVSPAPNKPMTQQQPGQQPGQQPQQQQPNAQGGETQPTILWQCNL